MKLEVFDDAPAVAQAAAGYIAAQAREAVAARGRFVFAVSGGRTPWTMLATLAGMQLPWNSIDLFQVDERVAPAGDDGRNLTHLHESFLRRALLKPEHMHAMPVDSTDLTRAAQDYAAELRACAGAPPVLDLVHLGLGPDGHTASLVPGDASLDVHDADVTLSGPYQGHRRMTLTYPTIDRSRRVLWVVTGADKAAMLHRLLGGDLSIPAGRVCADRATVFADRDACPANPCSTGASRTGGMTT